MEINNFLRKNLFGKHQEVENNKEEKKVEALNVKLVRGENSYEAKKQWLLENYPNSKEVLWYINEYDRDTYFAKNNVQNKADLMRRYTFTCNTGKLKGLKEVGLSTIDRLVNKQYDELGIYTSYPLICQLYDCLELGNIKESKPKMNSKKGVKGFQKKEYTEEEQELRDWYNKFDLEKFVNENSLLYKDVAKTINIPYGSIYPMKKKTYVPNEEILKKLKDYVESFETRTIEENIVRPYQPYDEPNGILTINNTKIVDNSLSYEMKQKDLLRNLLKDRLTEEEKTLVRIFGGRI